MKAVKNQINEGRFSNFALGRALAFRLAAKHHPAHSKFWRGLMRDNARDAVRDAKFYLRLAAQYPSAGGVR